MRKYDILKYLFGETQGLNAKELSKRMNTAVPNIYGYLRELENEGLIKKIANGIYIQNSSNAKVPLVVTLHSMYPDNFHLFLTPQIKGLLVKMCVQPRIEKKQLSGSELKLIHEIAIPSKIVLLVSKKPLSYSLRVNEAVVTNLLDYHGLQSNFDAGEFEKFIETIKPQPLRGRTRTPVEDDPRIKSICDEAYRLSKDIEILTKSRSFEMDEHLMELLRAAEQTNKEYGLFLRSIDENTYLALKEQWMYTYVYNTNHIEGNTMTQEDVETYLKSGKQPEKKSSREIHETNNMRDALRFIQRKMEHEITEELIQDLHFLIQNNIDLEEEVGAYKGCYNYVGDLNPTTPPMYVQERMRMLLSWYKENKDTLHPFILASIFHMQFELIHPFQDGNGRVGRLLMNHILEKRGYMPITVLEKTKQTYYRALENRSIHQFLQYVLTGFVVGYRR